MIGALIVSHGQLARELVAAAEMVVGEIPHVAPVSIGWHDDVNEMRGAIQRAIETVDSGRGVLILTDMFGGTTSNMALSFLEPDRVEVLTGVNLPMVIRVANQKQDEDLRALARSVRDHAIRHIAIASELIR